MGAVDFEGSPTAKTKDGAVTNQHGEALTMQYDTRIGLKTSFTGKDLLFTRLRVSNMDDEVFAEGLTKLDTAGPKGDAQARPPLLQFPIGQGFTAIAGPMVVTPSPWA